MSDIELKAMWSAIEEWRSMGDAEKSEHLSMTDFIWNRALSFARSGEGHEKDFPVCPHCDGTGLEVVSKADAGAVNEKMLAALEMLLSVVRQCHCENSGKAQDAASEVIAAAKAAKHGVQS